MTTYTKTAWFYIDAASWKDALATIRHGVFSDDAPRECDIGRMVQRRLYNGKILNGILALDENGLHIDCGSSGKYYADNWRFSE